MATQLLKQGGLMKPAPRWYRITKKIVYALTGSTLVTGTLKRFGVSDADALLIIGWMILIMETLGGILSNGDVYAKEEDVLQSPYKKGNFPNNAQL